MSDPISCERERALARAKPYRRFATMLILIEIISFGIIYLEDNMAIAPLSIFVLSAIVATLAIEGIKCGVVQARFWNIFEHENPTSFKITVGIYMVCSIVCGCYAVWMASRLWLF